MAYNRIDMIRVAIVASNYVAISPTTQKGTEFLVHSILTELSRQQGPTGDITPTVFASGDSVVPFPLVSIDKEATIENPNITNDDRKLFELALASKAFAQADQFDIYHIHISNGEWVLPFTKLIQKPVLITMYGVIPDEVGKQYLNLYKDLPNIKFVSVIDNQQNQMPLLPWAGTIPHGIDMTKYQFDPIGGQHILWAGRAVKEKGADVALNVVEQTHRPALFFPLLYPDTLDWFWQHVLDKKARLGTKVDIVIRPDMKRYDLASYFSKAKLTLIPISWEEPFGLVMTESMACGTPIVAYARGSTPDIVIDGKTGFLVNETESNKRGDWIIKKTGIAGLVEAVEKMYAMPKSTYETMRLACRRDTEARFSIEGTVKKYINLYRNLVT